MTRGQLPEEGPVRLGSVDLLPGRSIPGSQASFLPKEGVFEQPETVQ